VVFDRQYTPTLLDNDKHRYVPAEAIYGIFECKPKIDKGYLEYAGDKAASVRRLKRTSVKIYTASGKFAAKQHFDIVAGILAIEVDWAEGFNSEAFRHAHGGLTVERAIDCGFAAKGASFDTFAEGGAYTFGPKDNALAFFAFRLLSKLQSLGTVPAVDWMIYAKHLSHTQEEK
jgi:hypothetical protein